MAESRVSDATWRLTSSVRDSSQAFADNFVRAQEGNARYAQSIVENGVETLNNHAENSRRLMQTLAEHSYKQQDALAALMRVSFDTCLNYLFVPLSFYRGAAEAAEAATARSREAMQSGTER